MHFMMDGYKYDVSDAGGATGGGGGGGALSLVPAPVIHTGRDTLTFNRHFPCRETRITIQVRMNNSERLLFSTVISS